MPQPGPQFTYDQTAFGRRTHVEVMPDRVRVQVGRGAPREIAFADVTRVRFFGVTSKYAVSRGMALEGRGRKVLFERNDPDSATLASQQFFGAADAVLSALAAARPELDVEIGVSPGAKVAIFVAYLVPALLAACVALVGLRDLRHGGLWLFLPAAAIGGGFGRAAWKSAPWTGPDRLQLSDLRNRIARNCLQPAAA